MRKLSASRKFLLAIYAAFAVVIVSVVVNDHLGLGGSWSVPFWIAGIAATVFLSGVFVWGVVLICWDIEQNRDEEIELPGGRQS